MAGPGGLSGRADGRGHFRGERHSHLPRRTRRVPRPVEEYQPEDLATPAAFARDPRLVWEWYNWRRELIARAAPTRRTWPWRNWKPANRGLPSSRKTWMVCTIAREAGESSSSTAISGLPLPVSAANWPDRRAPLPRIPPHCPCGGLARPGVVWFGEPLPAGVMNDAEHAVASAGVLLAVGTSAVVYPAAGLIPYARQSGAR